MKIRKIPVPSVVEDCPENRDLWDEITAPGALDGIPAPSAHTSLTRFRAFIDQFLSAINCKTSHPELDERGKTAIL